MKMDSIAAIIDHTLLAPETTTEECRAFLHDALTLNIKRVCVSPIFVQLVKNESPFESVTVVGFPSGAHEVEAKVNEIELALQSGADEIDAVANLNFIRSHRWADVESEFQRLRAATPAKVLKVILETACLSDDEIIDAVNIAAATGIDFVKTSTGYHKSGGASEHAVSLMSRAAAGRLGVKASGGIRSLADANAMIAAGATRLGVSATAKILGGPERPNATNESVGY